MDKQALASAATEWLEANGLFLVDLTLSPDNRVCLEIESEKTSVDIDQCAALSEYIASRFDRDVEDYELEVASAGIGRPFKVMKQYIKHIGKDVEVRLRDGHKLVGILREVNEQGFTVNVVRKLKPEGAKRPVPTPVNETYRFDETVSVAYHIEF